MDQQILLRILCVCIHSEHILRDFQHMLQCVNMLRFGEGAKKTSYPLPQFDRTVV